MLTATTFLTVRETLLSEIQDLYLRMPSGQTIYDTQQRQRIPLIKKIGCGDWFFNDKSYWNLDVDALQPLKDFLAINLK